MLAKKIQSLFASNQAAHIPRDPCSLFIDLHVRLHTGCTGSPLMLRSSSRSETQSTAHTPTTTTTFAQILLGGTAGLAKGIMASQRCESSPERE